MPLETQQYRTRFGDVLAIRKNVFSIPLSSSHSPALSRAVRLLGSTLRRAERRDTLRVGRNRPADRPSLGSRLSALSITSARSASEAPVQGSSSSSSSPSSYSRSEERRVGKECRSRWSPYH